MKYTSRKVPRKHSKHNICIEQYASKLRKSMTKAESWLWKFLRKKQVDWTHKFEPQVVVHGYIPDFFCPSLLLAVEIDGRVHDRRDVRKNDALRTRRLRNKGVTVVRFKNNQVFSNVDALLAILEGVCR